MDFFAMFALIVGIADSLVEKASAASSSPHYAFAVGGYRCQPESTLGFSMLSSFWSINSESPRGMESLFHVEPQSLDKIKPPFVLPVQLPRGCNDVFGVAEGEISIKAGDVAVAISFAKNFHSLSLIFKGKGPPRS